MATYKIMWATYIHNFSFFRKNSWQIGNQFVPPYCNFLNSLCYARIEDLPKIMKVTYTRLLFNLYNFNSKQIGIADSQVR